MAWYDDLMGWMGGGQQGAGTAMAATTDPVAPVQTPVMTPQQVAGAAGGAVTPDVAAAAKPAGGGLNWGNAGDIMTGLASLAGVWAAFQQNKTARDQLNFNKDAYQTNLGNQTKSYNTALSDRITSQYIQEGKSAADAQAYLKANRL